MNEYRHWKVTIKEKAMGYPITSELHGVYDEKDVKDHVWVWILAGIMTLLFIINLLASIFFFILVSVDGQYEVKSFLNKKI